MPVHGEPMFPTPGQAPVPTSLEESPPATIAAPPVEPAPVETPAPPTPSIDPIELARVRAQNEERGRIIDNILAHRPEPAATAPRAPQAPPAPSRVPPDAATDPDGFARWLDQRDAYQAHQLEQRIAQQDARTQETLQLNALWQEIVSEDAAFARANERTFTDVFRKLGGHLPPGADPQEFKAYLVSRVRSLAGTPATPAPAADPAAPAPAPTTAQPAATANRTGGLSSVSSPAPTRKKPDDNIDPNRGLLDDLTDVQMRNGYFA